MKIPKWIYEILYSRFRAPYDIGPRKELVALVAGARLKPCKAIDLGSGTASNRICLVQHGFEVTGVDSTSAAIKSGRNRAAEAGVSVFVACEPGEIGRRFEPHFEIERYAGGTTDSWLMLGWEVYLMTRKGETP